MHVLTGKIISRRINSLIQKWLNMERPPRAGRGFRGNSVEQQGPDSVTFSNKNGKIIFSPFNHRIFRVYLRSVHKKEARAERNSWTIDLANNSRDAWRFTKTRETAEFAYTLAGGSEARLLLNVSEGTVSCRIGPDLVMVDPLPPQTTWEWLLVRKRLYFPVR